jgi:hypothetical protein
MVSAARSVKMTTVVRPHRADASPTLFSVIFPRVQFHDQHATKHLLRIREIETVFPDVPTVLARVPISV